MTIIIIKLTIPHCAEQSMRTNTMQAFTFKRYGKKPALGIEHVAIPTLKPDELLVKVCAASLNPIDNMIISGTFKPVLRMTLPATLGSDLAGIVTAVGSGVTRFTPGDAVFASIFDTGQGALADFAVVPERLAALKPTNLSFVEAAALPMVSLTSWQALHEHARLQAGEKVFIPAGSGGIGSIAIQLAKALGVTVATTTSTENVDWVRQLGADQVIDYKKQSFDEVLRHYDLVLGTLRGDALEKSLAILRPGGKIISLVGPLDVAFARKRRLNRVLTALFWLMSRKIKRLARRQGIDYRFLFVQPDGEQLKHIAQRVEAGQLRPVIDRVLPFTQSAQGLAWLAQGRAKGKVVIDLETP